jgi:hypothetical protein
MVEIYELATSEDGVVYSVFAPFDPGDVRNLSPFVKFRVTVYGDFDTDDYRLRGFSGIADDATLVEGGFGLSPFGRFPFGDGGVCLEDENNAIFAGSLSLSGDLVAIGIGTLDGSASLSGSLTVLISSAESGSLAMSGAPAVLVSLAESGDLALSGDLLADVSEPGATVGALALTGDLAVFTTATESGSLALSGTITAFTTNPSELLLLSQVGRNAIFSRGNGSSSGSSLRGTMFRYSEF